MWFVYAEGNVDGVPQCIRIYHNGRQEAAIREGVLEFIEKWGVPPSYTDCFWVVDRVTTGDASVQIGKDNSDSD